jgi:micrococcal nuclease
MSRRAAVAVVLALVAVLAGCSGAVPAGPTTDDGGTDGPIAGGGPLVPAGEEPTAATVTRVIDGDTVEVRFENGIEDTVRLLGVDSPETRGDNTPDEFEGVPETEAGRSCLGRFGEHASAFATERLEGQSVEFYADPAADSRGSFGRLLGYLVVDGENLNRRLVTDGHARVFDSTFSLSERFYAEEADAMAAGRGLWACATDTDADATAGGTVDRTATAVGDGRLAVVRLNADAEGNDNENLEDEYVVLENTGEESVSLSGWTVTDEAGRSYEFGSLTLEPGEQVTLHTGSGTDTTTDVYWGQNGAVWNNDGDTVTVRDETGTVVAERSY